MTSASSWSVWRRARGHPARLALGRDAGRGGADSGGALDLRRTGLSRRWSAARLPARQRPCPLRGGDRRRGSACVPRAGAAGGDPARAGDRACAGVGAGPAARRARPRVPVRTRRQGPRRGPARRCRVSATAASGLQRIGDAFARNEKRAALMPYLMAGFPSLPASLHIGRACVQAGADLIELGVPYSDPLADGPVIHAAGAQALANGASIGGVLEVARSLATSVPVVLMCYANMVFAPGARAFVQRLARTGACGLIVPDLPLEEAL